MVYTEVRSINRKKYYYRVISVRQGEKVSKKRLYLGYNLADSELSRRERNADERLLRKKIMKTNRKIEKIKSKIVRILKRNNVKRAGIFGSYSRGEQKENSDLDIIVDIKDKNMSLLGFIRLIRLLEGVLKRKVDLVEYGAIKPRIKERILKEEVRIIG